MNKVINSSYRPTINIGAGRIKQIIWYFVNILFFKSALPYPYKIKTTILKIFGARIGLGVVIKPSVNIKYPWKLIVGNYSWIGEDVWIDNLEQITIGENCCLSQGCLLLTGSHDAMKSTFDYSGTTITLEEGVWIGAKSIVTAGVICENHSILGAGSVADKNLEAYIIYKGNPAIPVLKRLIK